MKTTVSFGISILMGLVYLFFYKSLSPILDLILFVFIVLFIGLSYIKATNKNNHYIKTGLLLLVMCMVLIPRIFLSPDTNLYNKLAWTIITIILLHKEIIKEIYAIKKN